MPIIARSTFYTISKAQHLSLPLSGSSSSTTSLLLCRHSSKQSTMSLPGDIRTFLAGYPNFPDDPSITSNIRFYRNVSPMRPEGLKYDEFMRRYSTDYDELESNHGYIQWLFPIPEQGMNYRANSLQKLELESMVVDCAIVERLMRSYCMMMAFYGIRVNRGDSNRLSLTKDHQERLSNLSNRPHNLLRLTRILKLLSLFPTLSQLAAPLILFLTALHSEGHLDLSPGRMHGGSLDRWWVNCLRDKALRKEVTEIVRRRGKKGEGKWGMNEWTEWFDAKLVEGIV